MSPLLVAIFVLSILFLLYRRARATPNLPPGPTCYPIVGSANAMGGNPTQLHVTLTELAKKYGPVYRLRIGYTPLIVITDADIIRETFGSLNSAAALHFRSETLRQMDKEVSLMFAGSRQHWQFVRKIAAPINRNMPGGLTIPQAVTAELVKLTATIDKHVGKEVYLNPLLMFFTRNALLKITLRKSWEFDTENPEEQDFSNAMNTAQANASSPADFMPFLDFMAKKSRKICIDNNRKIEEFIMKEVRKREGELRSEDTAQDFLDMLIIERKRNPQFTEEMMLYTFRNIVFAGTLTVADTLDWMLLYLCTHPDMQEKCYKEISGKLKGRAPTMEDQNDLPFLDSVLKETLRIRPTAPLAMPHHTDAACTIGGYNIEKGSVVIMNLYGIATSDQTFKHPDQFDPDRWQREPELASKLLTFGHGPTACLGTPIAKQEFFLAAATLLQKYKFKVGPSTPNPDFTGEFVGPFKPKSWQAIVSLR